MSGNPCSLLPPGAPLAKITVIALANGALVFAVAALISMPAALGVLTVILTAGICLGYIRILERLGFTESRLEARLTLDELQRGVDNWRLATPFSISPDLLLLAAREILERQPPFVLELGSGVSTVVLARIIREHRLKVRFVSVEHDAEHLASVAAEIEREELTQHVTLLHSSLRPLEMEGYRGLWYHPADLLSGSEKIGLLIVDGPPKRHGKDIRYPAVPVLKERIAPQALILLDDTRRVPERRAFKRWKTIMPGISGYLDRKGHGTGVLRWPGK